MEMRLNPPKCEICEYEGITGGNIEEYVTMIFSEYFLLRELIFVIFQFFSDHVVRGWSAIRYWDSVQSGIVDPLQMHFNCTASNFVWSDINCLRSSQWSEHTFAEKGCSKEYEIYNLS